MSIILRLAIRIYQVMLSPYIGWHCRFEPSCSHYAREAIAAHGAYKGGVLTAKRLCRCRPGGGFGIDPVPQ